MTASAAEVLIIGAGPYGLSISAHLRALGVSHQIAGRPNGTYRSHVPVGMNLKSEPYASDLAAPQPGYDVGTYCAQHGHDYSARLGPLSLERFLGYADWYTGRLVPGIRDVQVSDVTPAGAGFRVSFADADPVTVRQVVVATGVLPFYRIPAGLSALPADLLSHTKDIHRLEPFRGRRVAVIGAGQSALETAALLHEAGADTRLVVRGPALNWADPNPETLSGLGRLVRPANKLCEGWRCAVWFSPGAFRRLPAAIRVAKARTVLGPSGSWWLRDRIEGVVETLTSQQVRGAEPARSGVRLHLEGRHPDRRHPEGRPQDGPVVTMLDVDHVIAGTGFRVDLDRLGFLSQRLRGQIATLNRYPVLSRAGQSSVPGLYFAGAPAAVSLGPSERFIGGTHNSVRPLTRAIAHRARASVTDVTQTPHSVPPRHVPA
jgi:cation diffusion facilitator CzcD-associated flavoprotein CzcO